MLLLLPVNIIQSTEPIFQYFETGARNGRATLKTAVVICEIQNLK